MPRWQATGAALRAVTTFLFIFMTFAAGHLMMVVINAADRRVSGEFYNVPGVEARWLGDRLLHVELRKKAKNLPSPQQEDLLKLAASAEKGDDVRLHMMVVSPFLKGVPIVLSLLGFGLLMLSRQVKSDAVQSLLGIFAGFFIWTGAVEYSLIIASRILGVAKGVGVYNGQAVAISGEYVLLKWTIGPLLLVMVYLLFLESNRCPFFLWFRKHFPLMRGAVVAGPVHNYAPRTCFQYCTVMWAFYVLLIWAYDDHIFGLESWFTYSIFLIFFAVTGYLVLRLYRQKALGPALRYAIATALILWNDVEILAKWGFFREPWLQLRAASLVVFFGGLVLGTLLVLWELRRERVRRTAALSASTA